MMMGIALKDRWGRLITLVNSIDGFIILGGCLALIAGLLVEDTAGRLVGFLIAAASGTFAFASLRTKLAELRRGVRSLSTAVPSQAKGTDMKKLVFDDFQPHPRATPVTEESIHLRQGLAHPHDEISNETDAGGQLFFGHRPEPSLVTSSARPTPHEFQISDFFDLDSEAFRATVTENGQPELRNEFDFLLNKVLAVIKEVVFAHTVAFFWANREKQQFVCETKVSDSTSFVSARRFPMGQDIVSQVAQNGKPELISRVNPLSEKEILRYYEDVEYVKSFVGVPVFFPALPNANAPIEPVGVIVIDSKAEDAFGPETFSLLGQFTKLVSALIKTSTDKYDLLLDAELLNAIRRLQERIRNDFTTQTISQALSEEAGKLLNWNFLSVVLYDEVKRAWTIKKVANRVQEGYVTAEQIVDFSESLVGNVIKNNMHQLVEDLEAERLPRYYRGEKLGAHGAFVSVPVSSLNKCYGALSIESRDKFNFSRKDIEILYRLAENAASALEILCMNEIIKEYVVMDDITGVYSKRFFMKRLTGELLRADDYGNELSLLLVTIDHSNRIAERYGQEGFESVLVTVAKLLRSTVRPYDIIGRYDYNRFGVVLVNTAANDAYIWAEKIRKTIASHIVNVAGKSFSVTVSAGVCGALETMKADEMLGHATAVLQKGMETGGNTVRVY